MNEKRLQIILTILIIIGMSLIIARVILVPFYCYRITASYYQKQKAEFYKYNIEEYGYPPYELMAVANYSHSQEFKQCTLQWGIYKAPSIN